jgi:hypothetical protein
VFLDLVNEFATDDTPAILNALHARISYIDSNIVDQTAAAAVSAMDPRTVRTDPRPARTLGDPQDPDHLQGAAPR